VIKDVWYPKHILLNGITRAKKGCEENWQVAAADTETVRGSPYTLQISFDGVNPLVFPVTPATILDTFVEAMEGWAKRKTVNTCYFHNLEFDLPALLYDEKFRHHFANPLKEFTIPLSAPNEAGVHRWRDKQGREGKDPNLEPPDWAQYTVFLQCFTASPYFAKLHLPSHRLVWLVDSRCFYPGSLKSAAELVRSPHQKLDRPQDPRCVTLAAGEHVKGCRCLGECNLLGDPGFEAYAREDVLAQWHVGRSIADQHREYDVQSCVSLPHMAGRILKRSFIPEDEPIPFPPRPIARAAELSYHGGLNFMTVPPGWYDCTEIDINSAYVWAMTQLPSLARGEWIPVHEPPTGEWGFLKVSGSVDCRYGVIFTHDFKRIRGPFQDLWVTTRELDSAMRWGCVKLRSCSGWIWKPASESRPFRDFALHFWDEKRKHKKSEGLAYHMPKLIGNSCYGKTVATTRFMKNMVVDMQTGEAEIVEVWKAGGMYNPVIGSWITAEVRATKLHDMAHQAESVLATRRFPSLHGSTDAIKTVVDPRDLPDQGSELGQWGTEITGPCLLFRPKLYIHERAGMDIRSCTGKTCPRCGGKGCAKSAFHGFQAGVKELLEAAEYVLHGKSFKYFVNHCWTMRQSLSRRKTPVVPLDFQRIGVELRPMADAPALIQA